MREWVQALAESGELLTVDREVDPRFELAAVTKRAQQAGNRPILFRNVKETRLEVVTNLFADEGRLRSLLPVKEGPFAAAYARMLDAAEARVEPPTREAPPPGNLQRGQLSDLPLITYHERDAGPYFTSAIALALDPDTGVPNLFFSPRDVRRRAGTALAAGRQSRSRRLPAPRREGPAGAARCAADRRSARCVSGRRHAPSARSGRIRAGRGIDGPTGGRISRPGQRTSDSGHGRSRRGKAASFRRKGAPRGHSARCSAITCPRPPTTSWKSSA